VCVSSLGYGADFQDPYEYDFDTDLPLSALAGQDQPSDGAVLALPVSIDFFEGLPSGGQIDEVHSYVSGAQDRLGFVNFQEPVVLPAPAFVTFGSLSPKQAADNALEKGQKRDNADESEHDSKRMRFNLPAPGLKPAPFFMDGFEDLRSDEIDPGNFYFCGIQGCFACFSTIEDRTDHEMRAHGQGYSQAPGFQVFQEDGNGDMMMAQDVLDSVDFQQAVIIPAPAPVERSIDVQPGQTICGVCDKHCRSHSALKMHMRTHTGERPFDCKECGSRFVQESDLKRHMMTHKGEKPYACSYEGCGKAFTQSPHLKDHMRIHSGEKPYACSYEGCGKAFTQNSNLKSHMNVHKKADKVTSGSLSSKQAADQESAQEEGGGE